jgi:hypothetical protein
MALSSLACSFSFRLDDRRRCSCWSPWPCSTTSPGVGDSSIHSTTLTELTDPRYLGVAYSLRSLLGFGAGAISPWVFGLVLDWGRAGDACPTT